jgi:oligoendopeptidase F
MEIWSWMYAHPDASPKDLKEAVIRIAKGVWNQYFAPVFGVSDQSLLAIYSHIIAYGMYTPDYALGYLIQFQMQEHFEKNGLAKEMERMCRLGSLTPDAWMQAAVGGPISAAPMIDAAQKAIKALGKKKV